jgi:hypothetical protein
MFIFTYAEVFWLANFTMFGNSFRSPSLFYLFTAGVEVVYFSLDHTQTHATVGRAPLDEGSARRRDLYLTRQTLYKRQTSMPPVGFEPAIPARAPPQTYAFDRAATAIGRMFGNSRDIVQ